MLVDRNKDGVDNKLREEQAGFRHGRRVEQLFILRNIVGQSAEWNTPLYINVNIKAFDSLHIETLWKIMKAYGIPGKLIRIIKTLYKK